MSEASEIRDGKTLSIEIDPATLDALDRLIDGHTISSRPDAIRFILKR